MSFNKALNFLKMSIIDISEEITNISLYNKDLNKLYLSLKNKKEIKKSICDINGYYNEEILIKMETLDVYINNGLLKEIKDCTKRFKIIFVIIEMQETRHINILVIDKKNKVIERYDTNNQKKKIINKITSKILDKLELSNYKYRDPKNEIFNINRPDCSLCVPLSLLYVFLKIKYSLDLDEVNKIYSKFSNKDLFRISNWFINYLN